MTSEKTFEKVERVQITLHVDKYLNDLLDKYSVLTKRSKSGLACLALEDWFRNGMKNMERIESEMYNSKTLELSA
jgi:hypothetical protein